MQGYITDKGNVRAINEDSIGIFELSNMSLYIIADGMGGHNGGEVASQMAVEVSSNYIKDNFDKKTTRDLMVNSYKIANRRIFETGYENERLSGMGTTMTMAIKKDGKLYVGNVGDSRCYVLDAEDNLVKITVDHSLVQELIESGNISEEESRNHPNKNIVTRALGGNFDVKVDSFQMDLAFIKRVLVCSDGLTNELSEHEICSILVNIDDEQRVCDKLLDLCKQRAAKDNISIIVFKGECI